MANNQLNTWYDSATQTQPWDYMEYRASIKAELISETTEEITYRIYCDVNFLSSGYVSDWGYYDSYARLFQGTNEVKNIAPNNNVFANGTSYGRNARQGQGAGSYDATLTKTNAEQTIAFYYKLTIGNTGQTPVSAEVDVRVPAGIITATPDSNGHGTAEVKKTSDPDTSYGTSAIQVEPGTSVTFKATADSHYHFVNWTESGAVKSTNNPYEYANLSQDTTLVGNFAINSHTVSLTAGSNVSSVSGAGTYNYGSSVSVSAVIPSDTAEYTYTFDGWYDSQNNKVSSNNPYIFTMGESDISLRAECARATKTYTVIIGTDGASKIDGTVTSGGFRIPFNLTPPTSSIPVEIYMNPMSVAYGEVIELNAEILQCFAGAYEFSGWQVNDSSELIESSEGSLTITVEDDITIKAVSNLIKYKISLGGTLPSGFVYYTESSTGNLLPWGGASYVDEGESFTLFAGVNGTHTNPNAGNQVTAYADDYIWKGWLINGVETDSDYPQVLTLTNINQDYEICPWVTLRPWHEFSTKIYLEDDEDNSVGHVNIKYYSRRSGYTYTGINSVYLPHVTSQEQVVYEDVVEWNAIPNSGYSFKYWGSSGTQTNNPFNGFYPDTNREFPAHFELWNYHGATWKKSYVFVRIKEDGKEQWRVVNKVHHMTDGGWTE